MKNFRSVSSMVLAFLFIFVLSVSTISASATDISAAPRTTWQKFLMGSCETLDDFGLVGSVASNIVSTLSSQICGSSSDSHHHASGVTSVGTNADGDYIAHCTCLACGEDFIATESDVAAAYESYITALPNTVYNGSFYQWYTRPQGVATITATFPSFTYHLGNPCYMDSGSIDYSSTVSNTLKFYCDLPAGQYTFTYDSSVVNDDSGHNLGSVGFVYHEVQGVWVGSGQLYNVPYNDFTISTAVRLYSHGRFVFNLPTIQRSGEQNNASIATRAGSVSGKYVITGDNGEVITGDNVKIIDEDNQIFYNPVTDTTISYTDYSYDYSSRSYSITTDSGNYTVTYGDEYVSIVQGDTITNIYYVLSDNSGSGGSGSGGSGSGDNDNGDDDGNWFTRLLDSIAGFFGDTLSALFEFVGTIIAGVIDGLTSLVTSVIASLSNLVNLFGAFGEAMGVFWSWLPPEICVVFVAGVTVVVFAAIIKLFLK